MLFYLPPMLQMNANMSYPQNSACQQHPYDFSIDTKQKKGGYRQRGPSHRNAEKAAVKIS